MKITSYTYGNEDLTGQGNDFKDIFIEKMLQEGIITNEQANKMFPYCFVVAEKGFFGKMWDKFIWGAKDDVARILMVKVVEDHSKEVDEEKAVAEEITE